MLNPAALEDRIHKCERILDDNPDSQIFAALADARRKNGELDKALRICRNGLKKHPDYGAGYLIMARINFDRRMYDEAEHDLMRAIELDGKTRSTDLLQVEIWIRQKKFARASQVLNELATADPGNPRYEELFEQIKRLKASEEKKQRETARLLKVQTTGVVAVPGGSEEKQSKQESSEPVSSHLTVGQALDELVAFPGMTACFMTDEKGMMIESRLPDKFDPEKYAAFSAEIYRFINGNVGSIKFGRTNQVLIELLKETIWIVNKERFIFVLALSRQANLGSLKLKLTSLLERMQKIEARGE